jgi:hypothetical protein
MLALLNAQPTTAFAQGTAFTYQGRVTDNGTNFAGTGQFKFALVTSTNYNHQATATANLSGTFVTSYNLISGGSGYVSAPTVTVSGGGGSGATATAVISGGVVTQVNPGSAGSGYSSLPTVTIAPPPANIIYVTFWSNDGTSTAGSQPAAAVSAPVASGLFTVALGDTTLANMAAINASVFTSPNLQLRIWFSDGVNGFAALSPVQNVTPTPYAAFANNASNVLGSIPATQLTGTVASTQLPASPVFSGTVSASNFAGNGVGLNNVNAATLNGFGASSFWQLAGNSVTGGQFLGSLNFQPLELWVNNGRALRLEPTVIDAGHAGLVNLVGGSPINYIQPGIYGSVIAGGGATAYTYTYDNGVTYYTNYNASNSISADLSFIGGGDYNSIQTNSAYSVLCGGEYNTIQTTASSAFIGGGYDNTIQMNASASVLGGGEINSIQLDALWSVLGGGFGNTIQPEARYSVLGGGYYNVIQYNDYYCFLGGGDGNVIQSSAYYSFLGGGNGNVIQYGAGYSVLGGGYGNTIQTNTSYLAASYSVLGGGNNNAIQMNAINSFLGGGHDNTINPGSVSCVLGGGGNNLIGTNAWDSVLCGGANNVIATNAFYSFLGGGRYNTNAGQFSAVVGGIYNYAGGTDSFAAGNRAKAKYQGDFVWADSQNADFNSTVNDQFSVRANGGVIFTSGGGGANQTVSWTPGSGSWSFTSDRNAKEKFAPLNPREVLEKVVRLPVTEWNYKGYADKHVGPMAQDFHAAFPFNDNDKMLNSADVAGVSLAAIQGLNQKVEAQSAQMEAKNAEIQDLKQSVAELKAMVEKLAGK